MTEGREQDHALVADLPATVACLRIVLILVAHLIKTDDRIRAHFLEVLRDEISGAGRF